MHRDADQYSSMTDFPYSFISEILPYNHLLELFIQNDMLGLQEALQCFPNQPGFETIPIMDTHTPTEVDVPLIVSPIEETHESSSNSHDMSSLDQGAFNSARRDSVMKPIPIFSPTCRSSAEPPSPQPQLSSLAASDASTLTSPGFLPNGALTQSFIKHPTLTRPSATRTPRSPLEARNKFKPHHHYPKPSQSPPSSHGQLTPAIQRADVFSGSLETENEDPYQNQALSSTTTTFVSPTLQYSSSNQSSQPASESDAKFHDKVTPSQITRRVLAKSRKLELGMQLEGGQQHRSRKFWRLIFSPSGPESRLEYVCDNPHSPKCQHSTSQSGDMNRHQERSTHLPPESNSVTCPLCGDKLKGIRSDAMRRHQSLQKCRTKRVQGARKTALFGLDAPSTSQVGEKRGWADMAGDEVGEDEYPAKVSKYGERGFILISTDVSELSSLKVGAGGS